MEKEKQIGLIKATSIWFVFTLSFYSAIINKDIFAIIALCCCASILAILCIDYNPKQ